MTDKKILQNQENVSAANLLSPENSGETHGIPDIQEQLEMLKDRTKGIFVINSDCTIEALPGAEIIPLESGSDDEPEFLPKAVIDYAEKKIYRLSIKSCLSTGNPPGFSLLGGDWLTTGCVAGCATDSVVYIFLLIRACSKLCGLVYEFLDKSIKNLYLPVKKISSGILMLYYFHYSIIINEL